MYEMLTANQMRDLEALKWSWDVAAAAAAAPTDSVLAAMAPLLLSGFRSDLSRTLGARLRAVRLSEEALYSIDSVRAQLHYGFIWIKWLKIYPTLSKNISNLE